MLSQFVITCLFRSIRPIFGLYGRFKKRIDLRKLAAPAAHRRDSSYLSVRDEQRLEPLVPARRRRTWPLCTWLMRGCTCSKTDTYGATYPGTFRRGGWTVYCYFSKWQDMGLRRLSLLRWSSPRIPCVVRELPWMSLERARTRTPKRYASFLWGYATGGHTGKNSQASRPALAPFEPPASSLLMNCRPRKGRSQSTVISSLAR